MILKKLCKTHNRPGEGVVGNRIIRGIKGEKGLSEEVSFKLGGGGLFQTELDARVLSRITRWTGT